MKTGGNKCMVVTYVQYEDSWKEICCIASLILSVHLIVKVLLYSHKNSACVKELWPNNVYLYSKNIYLFKQLVN